MNRRQHLVGLLVLALVAACAAPTASPGATASDTPTASLPSPTASPSPSPTGAPTLSPTLPPPTPGPTIAILGRSDNVLTDAPVLATCGTGCWGRIDVTLTYDVSAAQWGTLRVWDISERNGEPLAVREYPVYLRPAQ